MVLVLLSKVALTYSSLFSNAELVLASSDIILVLSSSIRLLVMLTFDFSWSCWARPSVISMWCAASFLVWMLSLEDSSEVASLLVASKAFSVPSSLVAASWVLLVISVVILFSSALHEFIIRFSSLISSSFTTSVILSVMCPLYSFLISGFFRQ